MTTNTNAWLASLRPMMRSLGQENRWHLVCAARTPATREELRAAVPGIAEPTFAFHLRELRAAGLLRRWTEGRAAMYQVDGHAVCDLALGILSLQDRRFKLDLGNKKERTNG